MVLGNLATTAELKKSSPCISVLCNSLPERIRVVSAGVKKLKSGRIVILLEAKLKLSALASLISGISSINDDVIVRVWM